LKKWLSLSLTLLSFTVNANSITLFVIPPPRPLSWVSPSQIAYTTVLASTSDSYHSIGHVTAKVDCRIDGRNVNFWSGMTSSDNNPSDSQLLLEDGFGMGILYYSYNGHHENAPEILNDLEIAKNKFNRLFTLKFLINEAHCRRMAQYHREYKEYGVAKFYGLSHKPRLAEGAGCTAYATSYLEVAGLLDASLKDSFSKTIRIPEILIGKDNHKVTFNDVLYSDAAQNWASPNDEHRVLHFYDTQFMYNWALDLKKSSHRPAHIRLDEEAYDQWHKYIPTSRKPRKGHRDRIIRKSNGFFGLIIDKRGVPPATDDIWQF